eukprot:GABU01006632.1.p1 GENE.GABU01006632.1~~GABU01006632.1.p1  ORF type:complete len:109 (-),score=12.82 GABU01006632.1:96-383(-)
MDFQDFKKKARDEFKLNFSGPLDPQSQDQRNTQFEKCNSTRSILVNRDRSSRDISRLNDSCSPKKKVAFAKNKMVLLFETEDPQCIGCQGYHRRI